MHEAAVHYGAQIQDILELLVSKGADINARANNGSTPLHDAIMFLPEECIKYLVGKGADPDIANDEGKTPRSLVPLEKRSMLDLGSSSPIKLSAIMEVTTEVTKVSSKDHDLEEVEPKGKYVLAKGQLISKCPYEKSVSSKIPTKIFLRFLPWKFTTSRLTQKESLCSVCKKIDSVLY